MIKRFWKYSLVGISTFLFDLLLLYIFTNLLNINYLVSIFLAFIIAVSLNYFLSRKNVFVGTKQGLARGYAYFLVVITFGVALMLVSMYLLVEMFSIDIFIARVLVAGVVGIFNFTVNDKFNFKM